MSPIASARRVLLYQIALIPGLFFPLEAGLTAHGMGSATSTAALVTGLAGFLAAVSHGSGRTRDVVAFSAFSVGGYVAASVVSTAAMRSPGSNVDIVLTAFAFAVGVTGLWLARDGRLDGLARAARADPR